MVLGICHFYGCDDAAIATVGVVPLCALHESYVLKLMDGGVDGVAADEAITSGIWSLLSLTDHEF